MKHTNKQNKIKIILPLIILCFGFLLLISFISHYYNGIEDQSQLDSLTNLDVKTKNSVGKIGAIISNLFINNGLGIMSFSIPIFLIMLGIKLISDIKFIKPFKFINKILFFNFWIPTILANIFNDNDNIYGLIGFHINYILKYYIGNIGTIIFLVACFCIYLVLNIDIYIIITKIRKNIIRLFKILLKIICNIKVSKQNNKNIYNEVLPLNEVHNIKYQTNLDIPLKNDHDLDNKIYNPTEIISNKKDIFNKENSINISLNNNCDNEVCNTTEKVILNKEDKFNNQNHTNISMNNNHNLNDKIDNNIELSLNHDNFIEENSFIKEKKLKDYDQKLDLINFNLPKLSLLTVHKDTNNTVNKEELEKNKNKIINTLKDYKIEILKITATIGPTVTLYEIVPKAGIRISKIKNLENDIALSLSALGIRIIAPIPGKGTIGIEVPNNNPSIVSIHSIINSNIFKNNDMELPIAIGKTITNQTFIYDLTKMPHLLMAGATGQGKSVCINTIITSLLYKKHPSELKFVMIDPKKVELTLYTIIEKHYLAKIPESEESIITDNKKVINTLNSLCIEMDNRYDLLKNAMVRNIKEYNTKFKQRLLNPNKGHRYLPYIVLIVDEFADLIMTSGKEVEIPIARLAQLARAIGIHLIVATQRPSVNVITGIIKANFPARIAFRVISKIDSRTILDSQGAEQLIGKGDLLFSSGNEITRLQCAFISTNEVKNITHHINKQQGYPEALLLPEYKNEEIEDNSVSLELNEKDPLFNEAAKIIFISKQGSASLLQRKLKLGYNRAGRLIDQLESAGIVGPFEGSKARKVLVNDELKLNEILKNKLL